MNLLKNDIVELEITGMTSEGSGVGRYEGFPIFVGMSAVGDKLKVRVLKVTKRFAYGKIEEIICPSNDRITPDCPYFSSCGGCVYRHINYSAELAAKEQKVYDALVRIGGEKDLKLEPIIGAENRNNYRNKALIPLALDKNGNLQMGFYAVNSHRVIDAKSCLLQPDDFNIAMDVFRRWHTKYNVTIYNESTHTGNLRRIYMRKADAKNELLFCVVATKSNFRYQAELLADLQKELPNLSSFIVNINKEQTNVALGDKNLTVWGKSFIRDELCSLKFDISPLSFYQVNHNQTELLYKKAAEFADISENETVLDLYCGTGTIGLTMAKKAKKLIGIEIVKDAVENAISNATINNITNAEFICADAASAAEQIDLKNEKIDVIIIDPPRKGCDPSLISTCAEFEPSRIVYVSCDPATLARDIKLFKDHGYELKKAAPVDMFPCTSHVETVVLLSNKL